MDSIDMSDERWRRTQEWIRARFLADAPWYADAMGRAIAAGLPAIEAGPETGRLLQLVAHSLRARRIVEVGTLAGTTTVMLARAVASGGEVITVESNPRHADFAHTVLAEAGVADRVRLLRDTGLAAIRTLHAQLGDASADLVFLDAQRSEYLAMLPTLRSLIRPSGVLAIDNALSAGRWLPDPPPPEKPRDVMEDVCDAVASDPAFLATVVPVGNGLLLAVRLAPGSG